MSLFCFLKDGIPEYRWSTLSSLSYTSFFLSFFTVTTTGYFRIKFTTCWYTNDLRKQRHNGSSRLHGQFREYSGILKTHATLSLFLSFVGNSVCFPFVYFFSHLFLRFRKNYRRGHSSHSVNCAREFTLFLAIIWLCRRSALSGETMNIGRVKTDAGLKARR